MSSEWVPLSAIFPRSKQRMISLVRTVERRCATTINVRFLRTCSIASWTLFSELASSALVASSKMSIDGFLIIALAIAIRCFSPPERRTPFSPTCVSYPSGNLEIKSCAIAILAACSTRSRIASSSPSHSPSSNTP
mmetsp:Transcript_21493/g.60511  ORF Transcript_21493/g.60511 Transcript_21493/m.60511 type:complete len:136 (+) Transcript_21493:115-522(+)